MTKLTIVLCFIVTILFAYSQVASQHEHSLNSLALTVPQALDMPQSVTISELEEVWQSEVREKQNAQVELEKKPVVAKKNNNLIYISDKYFELIGVFKHQGENFVLLKPNNNNLIKAIAGQIISDDIKVEAIFPSHVVLSTATERKEFKLFRWQKNEAVK
ncbi:hypothetical protein PCIT_a1683 [Pseudoalteromonas citrea]|uniref:Uncharacterized protein n=2 Tax=Pseudoalteromonas citrea TaxID=43655 RepID=A0AAD4FU31_9GAMM|nr:hypothetical protein [Pseudoalteromonas citrea]KAF7775481.1 hypothetical protein PCIT_a1683 [Pseudoalteromonas citrea]